LTQSILDGEIEVDESMYGGHYKGKRGWGAAGKHIVFGMYQRKCFVFTFPVPDRSISSLIPLVEKHSHAGSLYYSDDWHAYTRLSVKGDHVVIVKDKGETFAQPAKNCQTGSYCRGKSKPLRL
jgi:transposase